MNFFVREKINFYNEIETCERAMDDELVSELCGEVR